MKTKVIFEGDTDMVDFPFVLNDEDWLIPINWYLLEDELQDRPNVVYTDDKKPIIIIEHIQINYSFDGKSNRLSVIKTDRKMNIDDVIVYK